MSKEISTSVMDPITEAWNKLRLLFIEEREQQAMDNVQNVLTQPSDMHQLIARAMSDANEEQPITSIESVKWFLGMDRNIDDIKTEIEVATEEYNVHFCRAIAIKLLAKLPRELRDMVYSHLLPGDLHLSRVISETFHITLGHQLHNQEPDEEDTRQRVYFPACARTAAGDTLCPEYFWRDEVVGVQVAHELIETFYRTTKFSFSNAYGCRRIDGTFLPHLLQTDRFVAGFEPRQLISHYSQDLCIRDNVPEILKTNNRDRLRFNACLKNLWLLKKGSHIVLRVGFGPGTVLHFVSHASTVGLIFQIALPELVRLRRAGYRLTVTLLDGECFPETKTVFSHWMNKLELEVLRTSSKPADCVE